MKISLKLKLSMIAGLFCSITIAQSQWGYGSYFGTGSDRGVDVGFQPDMVIVKGNLNSQGFIATSDMPANNAKPLGSAAAFSNNMIKDLTSPSMGFEVGSNIAVSKAGTDFYYLALKNEPGYVKTGTYTGSALASQNVSGIGFQPDILIIFANNSDPAVIVTASMIAAGGGAHDFFDGSGSGTRGSVSSFESDGFTVNNTSTPALNNNGTVYYFIAIKQNGVNLSIGSYAGNGTSQDINTGIIPQFVLVSDDATATGNYLTFRQASMAGDMSLHFNASGAQTAEITSLNNSPNAFSIGSSANVNSNGVNYFYAAFGTGVLPFEEIKSQVKESARELELSWSLHSYREPVQYKVETILIKESGDTIFNHINSTSRNHYLLLPQSMNYNYARVTAVFANNASLSSSWIKLPVAQPENIQIPGSWQKSRPFSIPLAEKIMILDYQGRNLSISDSSNGWYFPGSGLYFITGSYQGKDFISRILVCD